MYMQREKERDQTGEPKPPTEAVTEKLLHTGGVLFSGCMFHGNSFFFLLSFLV